jgi:hypothetical protein
MQRTNQRLAEVPAATPNQDFHLRHLQPERGPPGWLLVGAASA